MIVAEPSAPAAAGAPAWTPIVDALRNELAEYGGLLQLIDGQQKKIFALDSVGVSEFVPQLEEQAGTAREKRTARESIVRQYAHEHGQQGEPTLRQLLPSFPAEVRPLLEALIDEINHLLQRTKKRTRQNQLLLSRLVEFHRELIPSLRPQAFTKTYSRHGQVSVNASAASPTYRAIG
jgi:flagellar biosynthesis/type III secretory pathway chaperone